ncbi:MAG: alpha/beta hydrolase [Alphaproteobacteria bacterium]
MTDPDTSTDNAAYPAPRLHAEDIAARILRSPIGAIVARPWFDALTLHLLSRYFFPLSRLWAAARSADGSIEEFYRQVPMEPVPGANARLREALDRFEGVREAVNALEERWQKVFFGPDDVAIHHRVAVEASRRDRRHAYNAYRRHFRFLLRGRRVPMIKWDTPTPETVSADYADILSAPENAYPVPDPMPEVTVSRSVPGPVGEEFWIRFPSPSPRMGDMAYARVYQPQGVENPPTLVFGHGVCVEFDHWHGLVDEVFELCRMGIRVVRPEAPWHGRRVPDGRYGGEAFVAMAPRGAMDIFSAELPEWAVLIDWCRRTGTGPVAVGGSSLGALASQLLATRSHNWPKRLQPDAMLLITHCGRHEDAAVKGALAKAWGIDKAVGRAGWTPDETHKYLNLIDPVDPPVMPPENIVSVLGSKDRVTPFFSGEPLVRKWGLPPENTFIWRNGHFTVPLALTRNPAPLKRFCEIMERLKSG